MRTPTKQHEAAPAGVWDGVESLAELARRLDMESTVTVNAETLEDVVRQLYRKHFGRQMPESIVDGDRAVRALTRTQRLCDLTGADPVIWVAAQLHGLSKALRESGRTFQLNMLCGPRAIFRYNTYLRWAHRRFRHGTEQAFDHWTPLGKLRNTLTADEARVGGLLVSTLYHGEAMSPKQAAKDVRPSLDWWACATPLRTDPVVKRRGMLLRKFGKDGLAETMRMARVKAMYEVAVGFGHDLPERIGVRDETVDWVSLAVLLRETVKTPTLPNITVTAPGAAWGV